MLGRGRLPSHHYRCRGSPADVNVDTVYALVGRKPVLLKALIEQAISGTDSAVVAEERD